MYEKFLLAASKKDVAGTNILNAFRNLPRSGGEKTELYESEGEIIFTENLDVEKINSRDFVIFASRHQSEKREKTLSVHSPGILVGETPGSAGKISMGSALFQKRIFRILDENKGKHGLDDYDVTLEATHHGPVMEKPSLFIEIGSTEEEWNDAKAASAVALTIKEAMEKSLADSASEIAVAVGGPHYCPNFNGIQLKSNVAFCHVIPKYALPVTEETLKEAIRKTDEEVDFVLLDWKGIGNLQERKNVIEILEKNSVPWKKTSDVGKQIT